MKFLKKINLDGIIFSFYRTEPKDWKRIKKRIKDQIMEIENKAFEPEVRQTEEDITSTFLDDVSVNIIIVDENKKRIIGYTMGSPMEDYWFLSDYPNYGKRNTYYIESTAILPEYQGRGLGTILRELLVKELKKEGYKYLSSHATHPAILKIYRKLEEKGLLRDCKILEKIENWVGNRTGYYIMCKII